MRPAIDRAGRRAWDVLGGFVRGTAQVATIDAVLIGIGLWLLDVPLAFALAVLVFMGSFVPYVGAFFSGLVAVLVAFADGGWELALAVLALVLLVQFVEGTFLQPMIQSRSVHLHPAVVLLAVTAGGSLFGIAGAYLAVPVTAVVAAVFGSLSSEQQEPDSAAYPATAADDAGEGSGMAAGGVDLAAQRRWSRSCTPPRGALSEGRASPAGVAARAAPVARRVTPERLCVCGDGRLA